jgi:hypothetical protein
LEGSRPPKRSKTHKDFIFRSKISYPFVISHDIKVNIQVESGMV